MYPIWCLNYAWNSSWSCVIFNLFSLSTINLRQSVMKICFKTSKMLSSKNNPDACSLSGVWIMHEIAHDNMCLPLILLSFSISFHWVLYSLDNVETDRYPTLLIIIFTQIVQVVELMVRVHWFYNFCKIAMSLFDMNYKYMNWFLSTVKSFNLCTHQIFPKSSF